MAEVWRRLKKNKMAMAGLVILGVIVLLAVFADIIAPYDSVAIKQNLKDRLQGPSGAHIFGTDEYGRDMFARLIHGARVSLQVGVLAVGIAIVIGGTLGAVAGYYGGTLDNIIMRIMDVFLAVPSILLAIAIVSALGPNLLNLMFAISISSVPGYARIVRASVISIRDQEFVEAAKAIGADDFRIIFKHIIPNALAPVIVQGTLGVAGAILSTAGLSFIWVRYSTTCTRMGSYAFRRKTISKICTTCNNYSRDCNSNYYISSKPSWGWAKRCIRSKIKIIIK